MKKISTLLALMLVFGFVFGKQIDVQTALAVGKKFINTRAIPLPERIVSNLELAFTASSTAYDFEPPLPDATVYFYVFNIPSAQGFVIVAADDEVMPVLGYSLESAFDAENIPQVVAKWLEGYKSEIRYVLENDIRATEEIAEAWQTLLKEDVTEGQGSGPRMGVNPLVVTRWNQSPHYNALCPFDNQANQRTVSGCVATAMAQIMKYWNYPATGAGFHSYNHQKYGTLSANFGSTTYQWNSMPNNVNSANSAVATLMYHCGVSVDMDYGVASTGGSGAYVITSGSPVQHCSEYALKTYFGYKNTMQGVHRSSYNQAQWINLMKAELNASRPILHTGFGSGGGHAFVCDGYDDNNFFHFNWGWGGSSDGYFTVNALNPGTLGAGGGNGGFNSGQQILIGIEPPSGGNTAPQNLQLYTNVSPSSSSIGYGNAFSVFTNIVNNGTSNFSGDYCAAVFDNTYTFIDYVEIKTGFTLQSGFIYTNGLTFSNSGLFSMLPGNYYLGIFYRPTGGNWIQVANNGVFTNLAPISVVNANSIEMYSTMTPTPGTMLTKGQSVSVNLNLQNTGPFTYTGQYALNLYNLDGSFAQEIGTINENNGLPSGFIYIAPFLTFSNTVTVDPGTYLMAVIHKPNNSANWQIVGSTNHPNPIRVTVQAPSIQPDQYENNNSAAQAYNLPLSFSGNSATRHTTGSNCHVGNDYDYFKIVLPSGFNYTISARLHDSYDSGNGNTYTLDALFSVSTNGSAWSDSYDDVPPGNFTVNNGGTLYFLVSPYFTGETGTYLLSMNVSRTPVVGTHEQQELAERIEAFPNPVSDFINLDWREFEGTVLQLDVLNTQGQVVQPGEVKPNEKMLKLSLHQLPAGVYFARFRTDKGLLTKKIILTR